MCKVCNTIDLMISIFFLNYIHFECEKCPRGAFKGVFQIRVGSLFSSSLGEDALWVRRLDTVRLIEAGLRKKELDDHFENVSFHQTSGFDQGSNSLSTDIPRGPADALQDFHRMSFRDRQQSRIWCGVQYAGGK